MHLTAVIPDPAEIARRLGAHTVCHIDPKVRPMYADVYAIAGQELTGPQVAVCAAVAVTRIMGGYSPLSTAEWLVRKLVDDPRVQEDAADALSALPGL